MKRSTMVVVAMALATAGCGGVTKAEYDALEKRVTTVETDQKATRDKLQALLLWVNHKEAPNVGLYDWVGAVHNKLWPANGPGDPIRPSAPPPPF
ncbi:MAG: hypothetical protein ABI625_08275 [bacterium]